MRKAAALLVFAVGCGPTVLVDGHKIDQQTYERRLAEVKQRAPFDFNCTVDKMRFTILKGSEIDVEQWGVQGCDKRATYVLTSSGWVMNTASGAPTEEHAQAAQ